MALTTTTGAADADSYATVIDADAYAVLFGRAWSGDEAAKEQALRRAAVWLDARYDWPGDPLNGRDQARAWPRTGAIDAAGFPVDAATIPPEVAAAQIEAAVRELAAPHSLAPDVGGEKVLTGLGPMSWTVTGVGAAAKRLTLTVIDDLLSGLVQTSGTKMVFRA